MQANQIWKKEEKKINQKKGQEKKIMLEMPVTPSGSGLLPGISET